MVGFETFVKIPSDEEEKSKYLERDEEEMQVAKFSKTEYSVESERKPGTFYAVTFDKEVPKCTCPAFNFKNQGTGCKHVDAVWRHIGDEEYIIPKKDKSLVRAKVNWVREDSNEVLVPLIPLGYEWTDDYIYFLIADLTELGYSKNQILDFFGSSIKGMIEQNSLNIIVKYTKALGSQRRNQIDEILKVWEQRRN